MCQKRVQESPILKCEVVCAEKEPVGSAPRYSGLQRKPALLAPTNQRSFWKHTVLVYRGVVHTAPHLRLLHHVGSVQAHGRGHAGQVARDGVHITELDRAATERTAEDTH